MGSVSAANKARPAPSTQLTRFSVGKENNALPVRGHAVELGRQIEFPEYVPILVIAKIGHGIGDFLVGVIVP
jgi:hypothetical protein